MIPFYKTETGKTLEGAVVNHNLNSGLAVSGIFSVISSNLGINEAAKWQF